MTKPNKFVSNHHAGRGVVLDCSDMAGESTATWSRGKFASNHASGRGVVCTVEETPRPMVHLILKLAVKPGCDWNQLQATLLKLIPLWNEIDASMGGTGLCVDDRQLEKRGLIISAVQQTGAELRLNALAELLRLQMIAVAEPIGVQIDANQDQLDPVPSVSA